MHSSSFRRISAVVSTILLAALVLVIVLAIRDNPSTALTGLTPTAQIAVVPVASPGDTATPVPSATAQAAATLSAATSPTAPGATATEAQSALATDAPRSESTPSPTRRNGAIEIPAAATPTAAATLIPPTFDPDTPPTISIFSNGNFVSGVAPMRSTLWAATGGGVVAWNKATGSYVKFTTLDGLATNRTTDAVVCPLPGLGVLFATPLGIQIFDTQTGNWKALNGESSDMRYDDVATLWCDAETGLLVAGYTRQGIDLFDARAGTWRYVGEEEGLTVSGIRDIAVVEDGELIWLATQDGLYSYRVPPVAAEEATTPEAGADASAEPADELPVADNAGEVTLYSTENSPLEDNRIETLAADGSGAIWLTSGNTLYRTDGETWDTFTAGNGNFPAGRLTGLDVSDNGTIWLGSDQTQLCRFDPGVKGCIAFFQGAEGMATAPLTSLTVDDEGDVYYTTAGGGLSILADDQWRQLQIPNEAAPGNDIRTLAQTLEGEYWVAGNGGASRFVPDGGEVQLYTPANSPLPSVDVRVVLPVDENAWLGTSGAAFYDGATWTVYDEEDGLAGPVVQAIATDSQKRVWLGTSSGLSIWTGSTFFNLDSSNGLPNDDITALQADGDAVWIGTRGGGLLRFQDNQLQLFNRSNSNLPGDTIYELARTGDGQLLIGTDQGLARFVDNRLVPEPDFAEQIVVALAAAPSGELWAATSTGELRRFNGIEWEVTTLPRLPSPMITELFFDADNALWVGTAQGGMARYTP